MIVGLTVRYGALGGGGGITLKGVLNPVKNRDSQSVCVMYLNFAFFRHRISAQT